MSTRGHLRAAFSGPFSASFRKLVDDRSVYTPVRSRPDDLGDATARADGLAGHRPQRRPCWASPACSPICPPRWWPRCCRCCSWCPPSGSRPCSSGRWTASTRAWPRSSASWLRWRPIAATRATSGSPGPGTRSRPAPASSWCWPAGAGCRCWASVYLDRLGKGIRTAAPVTPSSRSAAPAREQARGLLRRASGLRHPRRHRRPAAGPASPLARNPTGFEARLRGQLLHLGHRAGCPVLLRPQQAGGGRRAETRRRGRPREPRPVARARSGRAGRPHVSVRTAVELLARPAVRGRAGRRRGPRPRSPRRRRALPHLQPPGRPGRRPCSRCSTPGPRSASCCSPCPLGPAGRPRRPRARVFLAGEAMLFGVFALLGAGLGRARPPPADAAALRRLLRRHRRHHRRHGQRRAPRPPAHHRPGHPRYQRSPLAHLVSARRLGRHLAAVGRRRTASRRVHARPGRGAALVGDRPAAPGWTPGSKATAESAGESLEDHIGFWSGAGALFASAARSPTSCRLGLTRRRAGGGIARRRAPSPASVFTDPNHVPRGRARCRLPRHRPRVRASGMWPWPRSTTSMPRSSPDLACVRVDYSGGRGICRPPIGRHDHLRGGAPLRPGPSRSCHLDLAGLPSRARVSPDGRSAPTIFVIRRLLRGEHLLHPHPALRHGQGHVAGRPRALHRVEGRQSIEAVDCNSGRHLRQTGHRSTPRCRPAGTVPGPGRPRHPHRQGPAGRGGVPLPLARRHPDRLQAAACPGGSAGWRGGSAS